MMGMHLQLVGLVIGLIIPRLNCYKIKRTDCVLDNIDEQKMICTCGGIGDPFSIILNKVDDRNGYFQLNYHTYRDQSQNWECRIMAPDLAITWLNKSSRKWLISTLALSLMSYITTVRMKR